MVATNILFMVSLQRLTFYENRYKCDKGVRSMKNAIRLFLTATLMVAIFLSVQSISFADGPTAPQLQATATPSATVESTEIPTATVTVETTGTATATVTVETTGTVEAT